MPKKKLAIVVDANVARASGRGALTSNSPAPECIRALHEIRLTTANAAMCHTLWEEWKGHAGPYALKWLTSMIARKRFVRDDGAWERCQAFEVACSKLSVSAQREIRKDIHLVSLAMRQSRRVLSLDEKQRGYLGQLSRHSSVIRSLHWVNPRSPQTIPWIRELMPADKSVCIAPPPSGRMKVRRAVKKDRAKKAKH